MYWQCVTGIAKSDGRHRMKYLTTHAQCVDAIHCPECRYATGPGWTHDQEHEFES